MKIKQYVCTLLLGMGALSLVSACNHTDKSAANGIAQNATTVTEEAPRATAQKNASKTDTVVIKGMAFHPAKLTIHKGDKVVWVNEGIVEHDVSTDIDRTWTSGTIEKGKSYETNPDKSFKYICSIHPTMKGEIVVED